MKSDFKQKRMLTHVKIGSYPWPIYRDLFLSNLFGNLAAMCIYMCMTLMKLVLFNALSSAQNKPSLKQKIPITAHRCFIATLL